MRLLFEILRVVVIVASSVALGVGALILIDRSHLLHPHKALIMLVGFVVAIAAGLMLMRFWPPLHSRAKSDGTPSA